MLHEGAYVQFAGEFSISLVPCLLLQCSVSLKWEKTSFTWKINIQKIH